MKNQYAGDLHDYRKLGILRILSKFYNKIGVVWMLTENDDGNFGNQTSYLIENKNNKKYEFFDTDLYEKLREKFIEKENETEKFKEKECRKVKQLEDILNEETGKFIFFDEVKDIKNTEGIDLLFFDPDDGIGKPNSDKHLSWEEFNKYTDKDILIVQFIRYNNQIKSIADSIRNNIKDKEVLTVKGGNVAYFYIANAEKITEVKKKFSDIVLLPI